MSQSFRRQIFLHYHVVALIRFVLLLYTHQWHCIHHKASANSITLMVLSMTHSTSCAVWEQSVIKLVCSREQLVIAHTDIWYHNFLLPHLPLAPHICVTERGQYGSDNGLSSVRHQAITWTNTDLLSIGPLGTTSMKLKSKYKTFLFVKNIWKCHLRNGRHWVQGEQISFCKTGCPARYQRYQIIVFT